MFKYLGFICIVLAGALFFYDGQLKSKNSSLDFKPEMNKNSEDIINFRLQNAATQKKLNEAKAENSFDNEILSGQIEEDFKNHNLKMPKGLDDRIDTTLQDVYNDLSLGKKEQVRQKLEDEVQRSLTEMQELDELETYERDLFIQSFIENARRRGINIQIDKDLNVLRGP